MIDLKAKLNYIEFIFLHSTFATILKRFVDTSIERKGLSLIERAKCDRVGKYTGLEVGDNSSESQRDRARNAAVNGGAR